MACNSREEIGLFSHVASTAEQGQGVRTQWPKSPWKQGLTDVSGARGVAAPVPRTGQCRHEWTQKKNNQGWDPRTQERKEHGQLQADREQSALSQRDRKQLSRSPEHSALNKIVETPGETERQVPTLESGAQAPTVQTALKVWKLSSRSSSKRTSRSLSRSREPGFRRSWIFLSCSTLMRRSISLLRARKSAWTPQD